MAVSVLATTMMPPALWSDDRTILDRAARARAQVLLLPDGSNAEENGAAATPTATTEPPTTAGAEKNTTTEARFPQRRSICWTPQSAHTGAGGRGRDGVWCDTGRGGPRPHG